LSFGTANIFILIQLGIRADANEKNFPKSEVLKSKDTQFTRCAIAAWNIK